MNGLNMRQLIKLFENNNDITLIVTNDVYFDLVEELELRGHEFNTDDPFSLSEVEELYNTPVLRVSKSTIQGKSNYWFEVAYGYHHIKYVECTQFALIEQGILSKHEKEAYVLGGFVEFQFNDEELDENTEIFLNDMTIEFMDNLDKSEPSNYRNIIKDILKEVYEIGYNDCQINYELR